MGEIYPESPYRILVSSLEVQLEAAFQLPVTGLATAVTEPTFAVNARLVAIGQIWSSLRRIGRSDWENPVEVRVRIDVI
jgi:deoxycytidine triphosphate deaminase